MPLAPGTESGCRQESALRCVPLRNTAPPSHPELGRKLLHPVHGSVGPGPARLWLAWQTVVASLGWKKCFLRTRLVTVGQVNCRLGGL